MRFDFLDGQKAPWLNQVQVAPEITNEVIFESEFASHKPKVIANNKAKPRGKVETFHQIIKPVILVGQFMAMMPVKGITMPNATSLKFTLFDFRIPYAILIIFAAFSKACITLYWVFGKSGVFERLEPLLWFTANTYFMCAFVLVAYRWPSIMVHWERLEIEVTVVNPKRTYELKRNVYGISSAILGLSLIEHLLSIATGVIKADKCKNISGILEGYFRQAYPAYFFAFGYSTLGGVCLELLNCYCVFVWNFMDNFVIVLSLGLCSQYQHYNDHLERHRSQPLSDEFWGQQRRHYTHLSDLMQLIDKKLSFITMLSFSNNLYYVCLQLFYSFMPKDNAVQTIYFWFSLIFLIGRLLLVSFCAARINDESKKPVQVIRLIPAKSYHTEAKRFLEHVTNSTIALTGMRFFHVTRTFILKMAGTVVTYELVLVQLRQEPEKGAVEEDPCFR